MALLFDEDYKILKNSGLIYEEYPEKRFLIIKNYPLKEGLYVSQGEPLLEIEVLINIPANYNTSGGDMFWTFPDLSRTDGIAIPAYGEDPRNYDGKIYTRWSRHWKPETWKSKVDNMEKILSRIEWALANPSANK